VEQPHARGRGKRGIESKCRRALAGGSSWLGQRAQGMVIAGKSKPGEFVLFPGPAASGHIRGRSPFARPVRNPSLGKRAGFCIVGPCLLTNAR
jgi:hypothetical protein